MTQAQRSATTLFLLAAAQFAHAAPVTEARPDRLHAVKTADVRTNDFRVRIVGVPAQGNNPAQNSASCSDIQVFYDPNL